MKNKYLTLITGLLFALSNVVAADTDTKSVEFWLAKMHRAAHMVNYQGVFVYGQKGNLSSMKIVHSADKKGERERLLSLDGTGREVIRSKNSVTCILPDSKSIVVEKNRPSSVFPPVFPMKINELAESYHFSLSGQEMVAGHMSQKIVIKPKDRYRYGHSLWIDVKSGLLLKTDLMNEQGRIVEKFMFTQIDFLEKIPEELLKSSTTGSDFTWYESDDSKISKFEPPGKWAIRTLPKGFKADMNRKHIMPRSGITLDHLMYSDGLSSVSVFIEKHSDKNDQLIGSSQMGAINACGRVLDNGVHVTVVGEVTQAAVKLMCDSVYLKNRL